MIHIRALKQARNHGLILIEVNRITRFNQEACIEPYVHITRD